MAQVKKMQEGGKTETPKKPSLFYEGLGEILADDISSNIARNQDTYLAEAGIGESDRTEVMKRVADATRLINKGGVKADVSGRYSFSDPEFEHLKSTGNFNKKIWGAYKKDDNYYNNLAFSVIGQAAKDKSGSSELFTPEERAKLDKINSGQNTSKKNYKENWTKTISDEIFKGGDVDTTWWFKQSPEKRGGMLKGIIDKRIADLEGKDFDNDYDFKLPGFKDRKEYTEALRGLGTELQRGVWDDNIKSALIGTNSSVLEALLNPQYTPTGTNPTTNEPLNNLYTGKETFDWANPEYDYAGEREATLFRFPNAKSFYDSSIKKLRYLDESGNPINSNGYWNNAFSSYQNNGLWHEGVYYPEGSDMSNIPTSVLENYRFNNQSQKPIGSDFSYWYDRENQENDILDSLNFGSNDPDPSKRKFSDMSSMFPELQGKLIMGVYKSTNTSDTPSVYLMYDNETGNYTTGNITYTKGEGYKYTDNSGKNTTLLGRMDRSVRPKPIESNPRVGYEEGVVSEDNSMRALKQIEKSGSAQDIINFLKSNEIKKDDREQYGRNGSPDFKRTWAANINTPTKIKHKGKELVLVTSGENSGVYAWMDPRTYKMDYTTAYNTDLVSKKKREEIERKLKNAKYKEGGILMAQQGLSFEEASKRNKQRVEKSKSPDTPQQTTKKMSKDEEDFRRFNTESGDIRINQMLDADLKLSTADKVKLGALGADLASAIAGFVPGANLGAAAVGAASSVATFGADIAEDGLQMGDVGNFAVNLGLDVASIVPALKVGKVGKTLKTLAKFGPRLSKIFAVYGLGQAAAVASKLGNENFSASDFTTSDLRAFTSGLRSLVAGKNLLAHGQIKSAPKWLKGPQGSVNTIKVDAPDGKQYNMRLTPAQAEHLTTLNKRTGKGGTEARKTWLEGLIKTKSGYTEGMSPVMNRNWNFGRGALGRTSKMRISPDPEFNYTGNNLWYRYLQSTRRADMGIGKVNTTPEPEPQAPAVKPITDLSRLLDVPRTRVNTFDGKRTVTTSKGVRYDVDDTGNLTQLKSGGLIPKAQSGFRYQPNTADQWNRENALKRYIPQFGLDAQAFINTGQTAEQYKNLFNSNMDNYDTIRKDDYYTDPTTWVKKHQTNFMKSNPTFDNRFLRNDKLGPATASPDSENKTGFDNYYGIRTANRYLSDYTPDQAKLLNRNLSGLSLEYFFDNTKVQGRQGRLRTITPTKTQPIGNISSITPRATATMSARTTLPTNASSVTATGSDIPKKTARLWDNVPLLRGLDLGVALAANNRIKNIKESVNLLQPFETHSNVVGDLGTRTAYFNQAADLERWAARPKTSDASLQTATELDARMKGNQLRAQGNLADSQSIKESGLRALQNQFQNATVRNQVSNQNTQLINQVNSINKNIDRGAILSNANAIQRMLGEMRGEALQDRAMTNQLQLQEIERNVGNAYRQPLTDITNNMSQEAKDWETLGKSGSYYDTQVYKNRMRDIQRLQDRQMSDLFRGQRGIITNKSWLPYFFKEGSKMTFEEKASLQRSKDFSKSLETNQKLFRQAMDNARDNDTKLLISLDKRTQDLIKRAFKK